MGNEKKNNMNAGPPAPTALCSRLRFSALSRNQGLTFRHTRPIGAAGQGAALCRILLGGRILLNGRPAQDRFACLLKLEVVVRIPF